MYVNGPSGRTLRLIKEKEEKRTHSGGLDRVSGEKLRLPVRIVGVADAAWVDWYRTGGVRGEVGGFRV